MIEEPISKKFAIACLSPVGIPIPCSSGSLPFVLETLHHHSRHRTPSGEQRCVSTLRHWWGMGHRKRMERKGTYYCPAHCLKAYKCHILREESFLRNQSCKKFQVALAQMCVLKFSFSLWYVTELRSACQSKGWPLWPLYPKRESESLCLRHMNWGVGSVLCNGLMLRLQFWKKVIVLTSRHSHLSNAFSLISALTQGLYILLLCLGKKD